MKQPLQQLPPVPYTFSWEKLKSHFKLPSQQSQNRISQKCPCHAFGVSTEDPHWEVCRLNPKTKKSTGKVKELEETRASEGPLSKKAKLFKDFPCKGCKLEFDTATDLNVHLRKYCKRCPSCARLVDPDKDNDRNLHVCFRSFSGKIFHSSEEANADSFKNLLFISYKDKEGYELKPLHLQT